MIGVFKAQISGGSSGGFSTRSLVGDEGAEPVVTYISETLDVVWDFTTLVLVMAIVSALIAVSLYEFGLRRWRNAVMVKNWKPNGLSAEAIALVTGSSAYRLPFRQLCGFISSNARRKYLQMEAREDALSDMLRTGEYVSARGNGGEYALSETDLEYIKEVVGADQKSGAELMSLEAFKDRMTKMKKDTGQENRDSLRWLSGPSSLEIAALPEAVPDLQQYLGSRWFITNYLVSIVINFVLMVLLFLPEANNRRPLTDATTSADQNIFGRTADAITSLDPIAAVLLISALIAPMIIDLLERFVLVR